jgi:hypothetical protein
MKLDNEYFNGLKKEFIQELTENTNNWAEKLKTAQSKEAEKRKKEEDKKQQEAEKLLKNQELSENQNTVQAGKDLGAMIVKGGFGCRTKGVVRLVEAIMEANGKRVKIEIKAPRSSQDEEVYINPVKGIVIYNDDCPALIMRVDSGYISEAWWMEGEEGENYSFELDRSEVERAATPQEIKNLVGKMSKTHLVRLIGG